VILKKKISMAITRGNNGRSKVDTTDGKKKLRKKQKHCSRNSIVVGEKN
jgi:hypothetical protein